MFGSESIPSITYHMLIDALASCHILSQPQQPPKRFKWVSSPHWESGIVPERDMLFVCRDKALEDIARIYPNSLTIVLTKQELPAIYKRLAALPNKAIVVKDDSASENLLQKLQNRFLAMQAWHSDLGRIPATTDGLAQALRKSGKLFAAPLLLYNTDFEALAKSRYNVNLPLCRAFSERERETLNSIAMLRRPLLSFKGSIGDFWVENMPIAANGGDRCYLIALHEKEPTRGQRDLFEMIAALITEKVDRRTGRYAPARYSAHALINDLVCGKYIGKGTLDDYAFNIGFPLDAEFRLLRFRSRELLSEEGLSHLSQAARHLNGEKCFCAIYNGDLLAILHSKGRDDSLSNPVVESQLHQHCGNFDGFVAVSQVFDDISNLNFTYQQTQLVIKYKDIVDFERRFATAEQEDRCLCCTFEEILKFSIVDDDEMSQALKDFSFSHTILEKILAEDEANGTDDARILAAYIHHERKATVVAEKLHMHRNTVLYRIGKIEKRFGLNFDESWSRDRVLFDFSVLYCKIMRNPELHERMLRENI